MITKKERREAEQVARSMYQDVLRVEIKEDPEDESSLLLSITRGKVMPEIRVNRETMKTNKKGK